MTEYMEFEVLGSYFNQIFIKEGTVRQESEARLLDIPAQSLPPFSIILQMRMRGEVL